MSYNDKFDFSKIAKKPGIVTTFCKIFQKIRTQNLTGEGGDRRLFAKKYKNAAHSLDKPNIRFPLFVGSRKIFKKAVHKT